MGKKLGNMVWGVKTGALLIPPSFLQDNDVLLHWAPVEEAGDSTQIFFSKKVGFPCSRLLHLLFSRSRQWKAFERAGYNPRPTRWGMCDRLWFPPLCEMGLKMPIHRKKADTLRFTAMGTATSFVSWERLARTQEDS